MGKIQFLIPDSFESNELLSKIIGLANENYNFVEFEYDDILIHHKVIAYSKDKITKELASETFSRGDNEQEDILDVMTECTECGAEDFESCDCEDTL